MDEDYAQGVDARGRNGERLLDLSRRYPLMSCDGNEISKCRGRNEIPRSDEQTNNRSHPGIDWTGQWVRGANW